MRPPPDENGTNGVGDLYDSIPDTGRVAINSMPPANPEKEAMARWISSVERRLAQGGGGDGNGGNGPVPTHLRKTQQVVDFVKYIITLIIGLMTIGWVGHEYVSQFQTREDAEQSQHQIEASIGNVESAIQSNTESISRIRVYNVRIELEQQNTSDRLGQILALQSAETRSERRDAQDRVHELERRIQRREAVISDPTSLRRAADAAEANPLTGLRGL